MASVQLQPNIVQPNQFHLDGYDIEISYMTTSFTGVPLFTLIRQGKTLNFSGVEIQSERTQLGQMVTVNLASQAQAVETTETLTLLIPTLSLPLSSKTATVQTIALFNRQSSEFKIAGQSQKYMTVCLSGTASQVDF
jgi:hypothetical protein